MYGLANLIHGKTEKIIIMSDLFLRSPSHRQGIRPMCTEIIDQGYCRRRQTQDLLVINLFPVRPQIVPCESTTHIIARHSAKRSLTLVLPDAAFVIKGHVQISSEGEEV